MSNDLFVFYDEINLTNIHAFVQFQLANCAIKVMLADDTFTELKGEICGPPDTPYEGGKFILEINVPENYPFGPPKVCLSLFFFIKCVQN